MKRLGINWVNLTFFVLTPLIAIAGIIWRYQSTGIHWGTWVLAGVLVYATGLGIAAGYHRLFSHKSYEASWPVRLFLLIFGAATFEASARWWCSEHRYHHCFVDTDKDPYGINKGFWYAHIGWLVARRDRALGFDNVKDLDQDPLIRWQHRYYLPIAILVCFGLPTALAALWGDPWGGFFLAGFARLVFVHHLTWFINSAAHTFGRQPYSDEHSGRDFWLTAFFTYGEGYHNFHHEFPSDYRNGHRLYQWDPAKWLIRFFAWCRLSRNLRRTAKETILRAQLMMDRKRVARRLALNQASVEPHLEIIDRTLGHLQAAHSRFLSLKEEYYRLKKAKVDSMAARLQELQRELKQAREEFRHTLATWKLLVKNPLTVS